MAASAAPHLIKSIFTYSSISLSAELDMLLLTLADVIINILLIVLTLLSSYYKTVCS